MKLIGLVLVASCGFSSPSTPTDSSVHDHEIDAPTTISIDAPKPPPDSFVFLDAPAVVPFDVTMCPMGYTNNSITSTTGFSRYRVIAQQHPFAMQYADCNDDYSGWTHLVTLDTAQEATQIQAVMGDGNAYYVGAVQKKAQADYRDGWITLTGDAVAATMWQTGQPNDNDNFEDGEQNVSAVDQDNGLMNDVSGTFAYYGVCECDGKPLAQAALDALAP